MTKWMLAAGLLACAVTMVRADEGMWTFDNFPSGEVKAKYGFAPDQQWLDQVRLSTVRLAGGCSGSIVSGVKRLGFVLSMKAERAMSVAPSSHRASDAVARDGRDAMAASRPATTSRPTRATAHSRRSANSSRNRSREYMRRYQCGQAPEIMPLSALRPVRSA